VTEAFVDDRAFLRVSGPDAATYLQGQLSQDLAQRDRGLSLLLEPTGKLVCLLRVVRHGDDSFVLDTDAAAAEALEARLRRFLLRTKAAIEPVPSARLVRVFGGPPLPQRQRSAAWSDDAVQDVLTGDADGELERLGARLLDAEEFHRRRIEAGVPISGVDVGPETIPAEIGAWAIEAAVSFTKGCYTGQELVARIDSRGGNVPRPLRVLRFDGAAPSAGAPVLAGGHEVGHVTSSAADVALAPVARKVEPGAAVEAGGVPGTVVR
jgi:folate-binding protein YgfZ